MTTATRPESAAGAIRPRILIAGLGNSILQDDGIGVHAALALAGLELPGVASVEVGTAVLDALHLFEWAEHIIAIDAMEAGGAPGDIYLIAESDVASGQTQVSLHELSLKAALRFSQHPITTNVVVIGVEPDTIHYGLELTPPLQRALPRVVTLARRIVEQWQEPATAALPLEQLAAAVLAEPVA